MAAVLLDTTVLVDVLRGRPAAERIRSVRAMGDVLLTSAVNVEEITRGLFPRERSSVARLFDGLVVVAIGREHGELAGTWRREHAEQGVTLHQADCLIAAAASLSGARLATANVKDFPMRGLALEHWPT